MIRVIVLPRAIADLDDIAAHLAKDNERAATRFLEQAHQTFRWLAESPEMGRRWRSKNERLCGLRVWRVRGFPRWLIFYRPASRLIEIVRVIHGARNLPVVLNQA